MRRCPCCNLPTPSKKIGFSFSASSDDRAVHGVIGICLRCSAATNRLPQSVRFTTINRAADRALANPGTYLCALYPTIDIARLAAAMTQHAQHGHEALKAIGWGSDMGDADKAP
jgi:hypothetical protein